MNKRLRLHALRRAATCRNLLAGLRIAVCALVALPASARTIYDAGKALRENLASSSPTSELFTDSKGGKWSYYFSNENGTPNTEVILKRNGQKAYGEGYVNGFDGSSGAFNTSIRVNVSDQAIATAGEPLETDELFVFPGNGDYKWAHVRFTAPSSGWYSAFVSAHDLAKQATADANSGVKVRVIAQGNKLVTHVVSIEDYSSATSSHRFDFQMPVRYLAANDTIDVLVHHNGNWTDDNTGLRFAVTKEDAGAFYDSGIAMTNNLATTYKDPSGNIKDGSWYYLLATVPSGSDFPSWAPPNFNRSLGLNSIKTKATRTDASNQRGFAGASGGTSPYVLVNETASGSTSSTSASTRSGQIAPCEIHAHPKASDLNAWPTIRFRPPESGYYSASVVARDVIRGTVSGANGVDVYLLVGGFVVTNAYVSLETFASTAHLEFDSRLLVAGEPLDIVIYSHGNADSDATAVSAIFRREDGAIYDAGKAFFADHEAGNRTDSFGDLLGGGATWQLGAKTNAWCGSQFFTGLTSGAVQLNRWWLQGQFQNYNLYPYFLMTTGGVVTVDSTFGISADLLSATPYEFVTLPNAPNYQSSSPTLKATIPSDGIYRVRAYARDLNNGSGDGIRASVVAKGHVAASSDVINGTSLYETTLSAERLWLERGEGIEYVVDPLDSNEGDATGLSACYEICDASPSARVINIDFGVPSSVAGRFSNHTGAGREGWSDWNKWNALRISNSTPAATVSVDNCREADGMTKRNVTLTLARTSGNVTKGYTSGSMPTGSALHNNWAVSSNASDTYTFTLSKLKANESYTLYLYSAKGGAEGNASFTVGGVTKTPDETWNLKDMKVLARFDVESDANGRISGTFAAADSDGGAFNGLTIVGEFPDYIPPGFVLVVR